jgi:hypothetical protein
MHKRRNRKTITFDGWIVYGGVKIEICNAQKYGVYKEIVISFIKQLDAAISIHKRVLVLRLDFHMNYYTETNYKFSKFMKNITQWLNRQYGIKNVGYQWVREQERAKKQHYHLALILDGDLIQYPSKINKLFRGKWLPNGSMYIPKNCFYRINKHNLKEVREEVIYRVSYHAKSRGKQYRPAQTKDYYSTRLKAKT